MPFLKRFLYFIEINVDQDIYEIFNKSKDFLFNNLEIINNSAILLDSILKENSLNEIIEISSKLLDNPLILIDNSFKIIAYSNSYDITDIYWKENIFMFFHLIFQTII